MRREQPQANAHGNAPRMPRAVFRPSGDKPHAHGARTRHRAFTRGMGRYYGNPFGDSVLRARIAAVFASPRPHHKGDFANG